MRLLLTGATGFIGGAVLRHARGRGHDVLAVSRGNGAGGLVAACESFAPDAVVHAAGTASVKGSRDAPRDDFDGSVVTWVDLLEAVRRSGRRPVVLFPSSAAVYGNPIALPVAEDAERRPISPYGFHKVVAEVAADEYATCFGLDVVVARLFSVFGPEQRRLLVWELFAQLADKQRAGAADPVHIEGTGRETRDFCHVDDIAHALVALLERRKGRPAPGRAETLNVASGTELSVLDVARLLADALGSKRPIVCRGLARPGDPARWRADATKLLRELDPWRPRGVEAALRDCADQWLARERQVRDDPVR
jgi:UDP-glucose 4-epimerase